MTHPRVAILGAGFGGLCMGIRLRRAGIGSFTIFEKAGGVGGTWRDNTYPGAGCDIPSHLYSFSFEKYSSWTRRYPRQPEILAYLERCADKYGLRPHLRLNTEITAMRYAGGVWRLTTASGEEHVADVVVSGVGQLNRPRLPDIPGVESFRGPWFHSARWDHGADLTCRRVAVIGTGSSAAQFIPEIAGVAERVLVFQRTPNWVIPKPDAAFGWPLRLAFHYLPPLQRAYRSYIYRRSENVLFPVLVNGWSARLVRRMALKHLEEQVPDPELRRRLTPGYPPGCKRIVIDSTIYPALSRPDVDLITEKIGRVTPAGVETVDGRLHEADVIVYATGFDTTGFLMPIEVTGRDGRDLHAQWSRGAEAYLGMAAPGFPNLFFLYGPNTNLGHNSIVFMLECQTRYVLGCVRELAARGARSMEVRPEAMAAWSGALSAALARTVWESGCQSWYKTRSGRVTNNWPARTTLYRRLTAAPNPRAYSFRT
ncbi:flavin-containing monooxygenase [Bailinhaonella thermotolerans]|uniref:NAD(P)/FAD-dependent oxidoreductase n=1 Tax=Bailinhaonella thermotolerans TaxID=1070861 RepID=A0A3A4B0A7_9ACTN|nr:NAD(P)/FAD-dependent oxidoreductase [Bailinhaonella thermotolerans]RJL34279.1 NAD(P)/FAD-dependent oxidoreductase [Bailinhaonella thermotolerans]